MAYLLDSNLLIYSADATNAFLRPMVRDADNFASVITRVETLGFTRLDPADATYLNSVFTILGLFPVTTAVIERAIMLRQQHRMTLGDALIGATALEYNLTLDTRNVTDFASIIGLTVYDPFTG